MTLHFQKMHGLGNDFVVIDARGPDRPDFDTSLVRRLADRRRGIGCDQVIVLEDGDATSVARLRFYNADGSESDACGNGTRCAADLLAKDLGRADFLVAAGGGHLHCRVSGGEVTVDMGPPGLTWQDIPLADAQDTRSLALTVGGLNAPAAVSMGNPHCIFFVADAAACDLERIGPETETHPLFPERTNVELAQILDPRTIRLRVWERGAGITPACGSGACAALVAAARTGRSERAAAVILDGGTLYIEWTDEDRVLMRGPAARSFAGRLDDSWLDGAGAP